MYSCEFPYPIMVISVKIGREEKEKELYKQGVKMMTGKFTQTAEPNSWELTNSRPIALESAWNEPTRPFACVRQLFSLIYLRGLWQWDQDLFLVHELAFLALIPYDVMSCSVLMQGGES